MSNIMSGVRYFNECIKCSYFLFHKSTYLNIKVSNAINLFNRCLCILFRWLLLISDIHFLIFYYNCIGNIS